MTSDVSWKVSALALAAAGVLMGIAAPSAEAQAAKNITILPLGDSITAGAPGSIGGYRIELAKKLVADGYSLTYQGTQGTGSPDPFLTSASGHGGTANEGHSGWRIDQLSANISGYSYQDTTTSGGYWLTGGHGTGRSAITPSFILVMAGINDINQNYGSHYSANTMMSEAELMPILQSRITTLISNITTASPNSKVMLSNCIPYVNGFLDLDTSKDPWVTKNVTGTGSFTGWTTAYPQQDIAVNHYVMIYNKWLQDTFVPSLQAQGKNVYFVDQYSNFINADGSVKPWDGNWYADYGLHPGPTGYNAMGDTWAGAIEAASVPEPGTISLMLVACGAGLLHRRKRVEQA